VPCVEDAIVQLLHVQDVSYSYSNDLENMRDKFPQLMTDLQAKFFKTEVAVVSFADKPYNPLGYWVDNCYREEQMFTENLADVQGALDSLTIQGGYDWKESQYDAIAGGILSGTIGWETRDEVDGKLVLRVVTMATDAGPHVAGDANWLPKNALDDCLNNDYPSPAEMTGLFNSLDVKPIFVVTSDIFNYWKRKALEVPSEAGTSVLRLSQPSEDLFTEIVSALEYYCEDKRRSMS